MTDGHWNTKAIDVSDGTKSTVENLKLEDTWRKRVRQTRARRLSMVRQTRLSPTQSAQRLFSEGYLYIYVLAGSRAILLAL
jgi:hypothetical protein